MDCSEEMKAEIRSIVVAEVSKQLGSIPTDIASIRSIVTNLELIVTGLGHWKRSLWSNGSGGPPGYLETARTVDNQRFSRLFKTMDGLLEHKQKIDRVIQRIEDRDKQEAERDQEEQKLGAKRDQEKREFRRSMFQWGWKIAVVVFGMIGAVTTATWHAIAPFATEVYQDYRFVHHLVEQQKHTKGAQPNDGPAKSEK